MSDSRFTRLSAEASAAADRADWKTSAQLWRDAAAELRRALREIADTRIAGDIVDGVEYDSSNDEEFTQLHGIVNDARALLGDDEVHRA